jgi:catechol 2,3-dioxygenase-like lactoylglutathione lyase family enzyme
MQLKMNHAAIIVSDLERSIAFYRDVLGMEVLFSGIDDGSVVKALNYPGAELNYANLRLNDGEIELLELPALSGDPCQCPPNSPGKMHVCFEVDDIEATVHELKEKGVSVWTPIVVITEDPIFKGSKFVYFSDPDGAQLELLEFPRTG